MNWSRSKFTSRSIALEEVVAWLQKIRMLPLQRSVYLTGSLWLEVNLAMWILKGAQKQKLPGPASLAVDSLPGWTPPVKTKSLAPKLWQILLSRKTSDSCFKCCRNIALMNNRSNLHFRSTVKSFKTLQISLLPLSAFPLFPRTLARCKASSARSNAASSATNSASSVPTEHEAGSCCQNTFMNSWINTSMTKEDDQRRWKEDENN